MDVPVRITDDEDAVALSDPEGHVEYEAVTFAYPDFLAAVDEDDADPPLAEADGSEVVDGGEVADGR